jgi:hypothetical protein
VPRFYTAPLLQGSLRNSSESTEGGVLYCEQANHEKKQLDNTATRTHAAQLTP